MQPLHTPAVTSIIERLRTMTIEDAERLASAAPYSAQHPALDEALRAASKAQWDARWEKEWDAAWEDAERAAWSSPWRLGREKAWTVAWYALLALFVRDRVSQQHFETLVAPWESVMGKTW
jgi:hypothetical protein